MVSHGFGMAQPCGRIDQPNQSDANRDDTEEGGAALFKPINSEIADAAAPIDAAASSVTAKQDDK